MKQKLTQLATGRALFAGAIVGVLEALKHLGVPVPEGYESLVNTAVDLGVIVVTLVTTGTAHHAEKPNA